MNQDVTNEFLAAMFGAYPMCGIKCNEWPDTTHISTGVSQFHNIVYIVENVDSGDEYWSEFEHCKPILTPLTEITKEDEVELMEMVNCCNFIIDKESFIAQLICSLNSGNFLPGSMVRWCVDYLRSSKRPDGTDKPVYDCGFRHITSLIDAGLAVKAETK